MKGLKSIHVNGCPLCDLFVNSNIKTKLYYPKQSEIETEDDFIIIHSKELKSPVVIITDHTTDIGSEQWGRVLYRCRELFGKGITLHLKRRIVKDHWSAQITQITKDIRKLEDLRNK